VEYRRLAQRADDHRGLNCQYGLGRTLTFQQEEDTVLEAPTYWGVVELVRERVAEASDATPEEIRAALHAVGYSVQAVSNSLYRLL